MRSSSVGLILGSMKVHYIAIVERHAGEYWVTIPELPGVSAADPDHGDALRLAAEVATDYISDLISGGFPVPETHADRDITRDPDAIEFRSSIVSVEIPTATPA